MIRNLDHLTGTAHKKTPLRQYVFASFMFALALVLLAQMWSGERGLQSWWTLKADYAQRLTDLETLQERNADLRDRIQRLRTATLDLDFLEERARADLGMVRPNESVIFIDPQATVQSTK